MERGRETPAQWVRVLDCTLRCGRPCAKALAGRWGPVGKARGWAVLAEAGGSLSGQAMAPSILCGQRAPGQSTEGETSVGGVPPTGHVTSPVPPPPGSLPWFPGSTELAPLPGVLMHVTSVSWVTEVFLLVEEPGERDQALAWSGRRRVHQASWLRAWGSIPVGSLGACGAHPTRPW